MNAEPAADLSDSPKPDSQPTQKWRRIRCIGRWTVRLTVLGIVFAVGYAVGENAANKRKNWSSS